jgi:hypothetical protein
MAPEYARARNPAAAFPRREAWHALPARLCRAARHRARRRSGCRRLHALLRERAGISTITLKRADGANVTRVRHGLKTFVIRDRSSIHNFHLFGPGGVDRKTGIAFVGTRTWSPVKLVAGPTSSGATRPTTMRKTFVVF